MKNWKPLLRFELDIARRSRTVLLFALGFSAAAVTLALTGLSSGGVFAVQGFGRTTMSLLQLVLWVVPLIGLLLGSSTAAEWTDHEFQAALPLPRAAILQARWLAWLLVLGGSMTVGLTVAGTLIAAAAGPGDAWRYFRLMAVSNVLLAACLALGIWVGTVTQSRLRALGSALVLWVVLVIGIDLVALGVLSLLPPGPAAWSLSALLLLDPVDATRALAITVLQADLVAGPTGAALRKVLGGWGLWGMCASLVAWTVVPLVRASRRFARMDL